MAIGDALRTLALTDSTISTAVGGERISPNILPPEATIPAMSYMRVTAKPMMDNCDTVSTRARFQFTIFANSKAQANSLYDALVAKFHKYSGTSQGVNIIAMWLDHSFDMKEPETQVWKHFADFTVIYEGY